jgi:hypothetical protein
MPGETHQAVIAIVPLEVVTTFLAAGSMPVTSACTTLMP